MFSGGGWKKRLGKGIGFIAAVEIATLAGTYFFYRKTNRDPDFRSVSPSLSYGLENIHHSILEPKYWNSYFVNRSLTYIVPGSPS